MDYKMNDNCREIADFFKALGDPTRFKVLSLLMSYKNLCVGAIAQKLGISQPAVSQHLRVLKNEGIVTSKRMGFHIHYQVNNGIFEKFGLKMDRLIIGPKNNCELKEQCKISPDSI
jgi:ArsR family transcriptional regulator